MREANALKRSMFASKRAEFSTKLKSVVEIRRLCSKSLSRYVSATQCKMNSPSIIIGSHIVHGSSCASVVMPVPYDIYLRVGLDLGLFLLLDVI